MYPKQFVALFSVALCASALFTLTGCDEKTAAKASSSTTTAESSSASTQTVETSASVTTSSSSTKTINGIQIEDVEVGDGTEAKRGNTVSVNYLGTLATNGRKFDSSYDRNEPFTFKLGSGQVIEGWEKGIVGMKEGGKRILTIPPDKAYGPSGYPPVIPANATLKFEVELVEVQ